MKRILQSLFFLVLPACTLAAPEQPMNTDAGISAAMIVHLVMGLLLIIGLIVVSAFLLKYLNQIRFRAGKGIRVLSALPLGARERLMVVETEGVKLLLGLTPGRITHLHTFSETSNQKSFDAVLQGQRSGDSKP